jgi:hypothetical protein
MMPVTFTLHERYGIYSASEAHDWFLRQLRDHETVEVWDEYFGDLRDLEWPHQGSIEIVQGEDMGARSLLRADITPESGSSIRVSGSARVMET